MLAQHSLRLEHFAAAGDLGRLGSITLSLNCSNDLIHADSILIIFNGHLLFYITYIDFLMPGRSSSIFPIFMAQLAQCISPTLTYFLIMVLTVTLVRSSSGQVYHGGKSNNERRGCNRPNGE